MISLYTSRPHWGQWIRHERCPTCGFTTRQMVSYAYVCPECGCHCSSPTVVAIRFEFRDVLWLWATPTGRHEVKPDYTPLRTP